MKIYPSFVAPRSGMRATSCQFITYRSCAWQEVQISAHCFTLSRFYNPLNSHSTFIFTYTRVSEYFSKFFQQKRSDSEKNSQSFFPRLLFDFNLSIYYIIIFQSSRLDIFVSFLQWRNSDERWSPVWFRRNSITSMIVSPVCSCRSCYSLHETGIVIGLMTRGARAESTRHIRRFGSNSMTTGSCLSSLWSSASASSVWALLHRPRVSTR